MNYSGKFIIEKDDGRGNVIIQIPKSIKDFPDKKDIKFEEYAFWQSDDKTNIMKPLTKTAKKNLKEICAQLSNNYIGVLKGRSKEILPIEYMLLGSFRNCTLVGKD